ncbi:FIST signal transduction protein [Alteromonas sp. PRIM-21]|uniref:FIST signal transduction protein n=1 Tax=Alteromonas sp. PRIM-21 TaxID=1454978 RepID=UPI0022B9AB9D|nr:FIST C-terminal domain-containing protein [Alteromonas sp. PRIM-21]MCZ8528448.1 FIST C-terminal domain-containing protein [Alteromonas sp. PRIM-21]
MNIQTFALQCGSTASVTSQLENILSDTRPSLLIGYGNTDLPLETLASTINDTALPFFISSSCLGALLCDNNIASPTCDLALFCINDENGAFGVGSADITDCSPFKAGATSLQKALANAERPYESPALIWCSLPPGNEERILEGFASVVGTKVPIFGGSMADNTVSGNWCTATNTTSGPQTVAVAVLYPSTPLGLSYSSGYKPTETVFRATTAQGRQLQQLDNGKASTIYNNATNGLIADQLNGGQILGLTSSAPLGKPVALDNGAVNYLLCHPDSVDKDGTLNVFSEVQEGEELVLMEGNITSLTSRAERVINNAIMLLPENKTPVGVLMIYCAGCRLMVGDEINAMLNSLQKTFPSLPICGPFTFGEQGRFLDGKNRHGNLMISAVVFSQ